MGVEPGPTGATIVVVGAGLAGLELAARLGELGVSDVLVLEAGPLADRHHIHATRDHADATRMVFDPRTDPDFHRPWSSDSAHYTGISGLRRRFGGRSLYWHGVSLRLEDWALRDWPDRVVAELTEQWRGGPGLYAATEADLARWAGRPLSGTTGPGPVTAPIGGRRFRRLPTARRCSGDGRWSAYTPVAGWQVDHAAGDSVLRAGPHGPWARCGVEVLDVLTGATGPTGVLVRDRDGTTSVVAARLVVLCAGAVESARLATQVLHRTGALPNPRLGRLADHIVQGFTVRLPGAGAFFAGRGVGADPLHLPADPAIRSYLRLDLHADGSDEVLLDVRATGEQAPTDVSAVECEPRAAPPWPVRVRTTTTAPDQVVIDGQRALLARFWARLADELGRQGAALRFPAFGSGEQANDRVLPEVTTALTAGVPDAWSSLLGTEDHEGGCLPIGPVLTEDQEFRALPGLFAHGPAVFPRLGAANPSLTTLALSRRLAATLAASPAVTPAASPATTPPSTPEARPVPASAAADGRWPDAR